MIPSPDAHTARSPLAAACCAELRAQGVAHEHRSLHFRVQLASGETAQYDPDLAARRGPILFLIEPLNEDGDKRRQLELLSAFLEQHSPEIVLVLVAPRERITSLPASSYDEVYASEDLPAVVRRIREQDPKGMLRPFSKPKA